MHENWRLYRLAMLLPAALASAWMGYRAPFRLAAGCLAVAFLLLFWRGWVAAVAAAYIAIGIHALWSVDVYRQTRCDLMQTVEAREMSVLTGILSSEVYARRDRVHFDLLAETVDTRQLKKPAVVRIAAAWLPEDQLQQLMPGQSVRVWAQLGLAAPYRNPGMLDRDRWMMAEGIHTLGWLKSPQLLQLQGRRPQPGPRRFLALTRSRLSDRLRRFRRPGSETRAALLETLLLGDLSRVPETVLRSFRRTGTFHVLVLSGMHLSFLALATAALLRRARLPAVCIAVLVPLVTLLFAGVVGARAPVLRAAWMVLWVALGHWLSRRVDLLNALAVVACAMLAARPRLVLDVGFWLTIACLWSVSVVGWPLYRAVLSPEWEGFRSVYDGRIDVEAGRRGRRRRRVRFWIEWWLERFWPALRLSRRAAAVFRVVGWCKLELLALVAVSFGVQLMTLPILAYEFNQASLLAFVCNLAIVPLSSWLILWSAVVAVAPAKFGFWLSDCAVRQVGWLLAIVESMSHWPALLRFVAQPPLWILAASFVAAVALALCRGWRQRAAYAAAAALVVWLSLGIYGDPPTGLLQVAFLDVGQGDAIVLHLPDGQVLLVDGGGVAALSSRVGDLPRFEIGREVVARYLWAESVRSVQLAAITHAHQDHAQGVEQLCAYLPCGSRWNPEKGQVLTVGGVRLEVLHPCTKRHENLNNRSLVVRLQYGRSSVLLTGDIEREVEEELLESTAPLRADVLKVAHHGSDSSSTSSFLDAVSPRFAVISVGAGNYFGHPSAKVLDRLKQRGVTPFRTDRDGMVRLSTDGFSWWAETFGSPRVSNSNGSLKMESTEATH